MPIIVLTLVAAAGGVLGTVRAEGTLEPIPYASVEVLELERRAGANDRGVYMLVDLPPGEWHLRASALGHRPDTILVRVPVDGEVRVGFALATQPVALEGIEVSGTPEPTEAAPTSGPPPVRMEGPTLALVPGLAEPDVFRALQSLPSVAAASDFSSALYVRGGLPNQNLITLDGAPLFNPYHLGGLFAAIDPSAVGSVDVLAGAFPAGVGDRLSSAIRIRTRDGGRDRVRGSGAVGLLSSRASVNGPLFDGDGSFLVSARRTYLDLFTDAAYYLGLIDFTVPYAFTDVHAKITRDVGAIGSLSAAFYWDGEGIGMPERMVRESNGGARFAWGTRVGSVTFRAPLSATTLGRFRIGWSDFYGSFDAWDIDPGCPGQPIAAPCSEPDTRDALVDATTGVRDALASADLTWYRTAHQLRTGVRIDAYEVEHDVPIAETDGFVPVFSRHSELATVAAYVEDEWHATDALRLRFGLRSLYADDREIAWMPRVGARLALSPRWSLSAGGGRYAQALYSLRNPESLAASLIAYDLLDVLPAHAGFSTAADATVGVAWTTPAWNVRVDAYAKRMQGLQLPPVPADVLNASPLSIGERRAGEGRAAGVELFARHTRGDAELTLAYNLGFAAWRVDGRTYTPRFERRHTLDASAALPLGDDGVLSTRLALASGQPFTPVRGRVRPVDWGPRRGPFVGVRTHPVVLLGDHNSARLPGYFRLDVAARKSFDKDWFGVDLTLTPYLQILNVLNWPNPLVGIPSGGFRGRPEVEFAPQLPILPTFGVEWTF
ncbi:MAG: TonB-dependent receptor [Gemmatimonadota bacterium]